MIYTDKEKQIAKEFIDCKIPNYMYDYDEEFKKTHHLDMDTMEYYEALFDYAHCILDDYKLESNFSKALRNKELYFLIMKQKKNIIQKHFSNKVSMLFEVIKKYIEI